MEKSQKEKHKPNTSLLFETTSFLEETLPQLINSQIAMTFRLLAIFSRAVQPFLLHYWGTAPVGIYSRALQARLLEVNTL